MNMMTSVRPATGALPLAHTTHPVRSRVGAMATAIGAYVDREASEHDPLLAGSLLMPFANLALTGTSCARPMWLPECQAIAQATGVDMLLLRSDPDRGTSFDVRFEGSARWLCRHLAWRRRGGDLWLIPSTTDGPFIRAGEWGLEQVMKPPFDSAGERHAGIILARENPSFAGSL